MPRRGPEFYPRAPPRAFCPGPGRACPFPLHSTRLALTVRGGASPLSRVASGLRAASGLWLPPAISAVSSHPAPARPPAASGAPAQPFRLETQYYKARHAQRAGRWWSRASAEGWPISASGRESTSTSDGFRREGLWVSWAVTAPLGLPLFPSGHCGVGGCRWFRCRG